MNQLRTEFLSGEPSFAACSDIANGFSNMPWAPVTVTGERMNAEIERLADLAPGADGRRASAIVHPAALPGIPALAPGIQVELSVLRPGERTPLFRHNATEVNFCLQGSGSAQVGERTVSFARFDVWNTPSYTGYIITNTGKDLLVWLSYANAPLLKYMQVYIAERDFASTKEDDVADEHADNPRRTSPFGTFEIGDDGASLMPYERLINPPAVDSRVLYWPWTRVEAELEKLEQLGAEYVGRRLYLLYNPMTGRTNGTTPSFFATMTIRPPKIVDRPHRHVSAAINYYFRGSGRSTVAGNTYEWKAGDLMLSAPGWTVHNHASYDERVYELTIQDQPLNIIMESLLWQENLKAAPALLGARVGFDTNRTRIGG